MLPAYYSDNFLSLLPGERKTVLIEAAVSSLGGQTPVVTVDGWNVTTATRSFPNGAAVAPNKDAFVGPK